MSMETARSVNVGGHLRVAPEGWVFVTNDPEVVKAPNRTLSLFHRENRVVVIVDTRIETFAIRDLQTRREFRGSRFVNDPRAIWRVGTAPFQDLGDLGRAIDAVLTTAE